jgi:hypothetical protein
MNPRASGLLSWTVAVRPLGFGILPIVALKVFGGFPKSCGVFHHQSNGFVAFSAKQFSNGARGPIVVNRKQSRRARPIAIRFRFHLSADSTSALLLFVSAFVFLQSNGKPELQVAVPCNQLLLNCAAVVAVFCLECRKNLATSTLALPIRKVFL